MTLIKLCSGCKKQLSLNMFGKNSCREDGLQDWCKTCRSTAQTRSILYKSYQQAYHKKYRALHRSELNDKSKQYRFLCQDKIREYYQKTREKHIKDCTKRNALRFKNDSDFRLIRTLRRRIKMAVSRNTKSGSTLELLGCSINELKKHLQETAIINDYSGFDINNYSGKEYHIDHIIPCSAFNLKCSFHQKLCFNWSNLQILDAKSNLVKNNKTNED